MELRRRRDEGHGRVYPPLFPPHPSDGVSSPRRTTHRADDIFAHSPCGATIRRPLFLEEPVQMRLWRKTVSVRRRLFAAIMSSAFALGGCASGSPVVQPVPVTSATTDKFYYVSADTFMQAGPDEHSRQQQMLTRPAFGPYQANQTTLQLVVGGRYLFYPRCADAISWIHVVNALISSSTDQIEVECRTMH